MAWQGIETSRASGAPDTSGAVMSVISPSGPDACGHRMVAVVCLTGSSGTKPHSSTPAMPATTAIRRANRRVRSSRSSLWHEARWYATQVCEPTMRGRAQPYFRTAATAPGSTIRSGSPIRAPASPIERRVVLGESLQRTPVANNRPDSSAPGLPAEQSVMPSGRRRCSRSQANWLGAESVGQDSPLGHFGDAVLVADGRWHGNPSPTSQSSSTDPRSRRVLQGAQLRDARWRHRDPVLGSRSSSVATRRTQWRRPGSRPSEPAGCARRAPRRRRRTRDRRPAVPWPPVRRSAHCRPTSPGSKRPAAATTSNGPAVAPGGSRYHAERSTAGCWVPLRQLPIPGCVAGSRPYGRRACEPLTPAAAVVPLGARLTRRSTASVGVGEVGGGPGAEAPRRPIRRTESRWARSPLRSPRRGPPDRHVDGRQHAVVRVLFDDGRPRPCRRSCPRPPRGWIGRHPGRVLVVIARVSDSTSKTTNPTSAIANGDWTIRAIGDGGPGGDIAAREVEPRRQQQRQDRQSEQMVVKPNFHSGNCCDHGTPKLETYHQPLTVANDSAIMSSTAAANTERLRRERIATAVTATAASAPSDPASPANTRSGGSTWSG